MGIARSFVVLAVSAAIAGCSAAPRADHPQTAVSLGAAAKKTDTAGLDWHPLLPAPFGTLLKDMPLPLHEVLLFHDATQSSTDTDNKDCYASDRVPPVFLNGTPRVYLFCFTHDRLTRIEALVDLSPTTAYATFAHACELWHSHAHAAAVASPTPADLCEGQEVGIGFSARVATDADSDSDGTVGTKALTATFTAFSLADGPSAESPAVEAKPRDGGPITPPHP